MTKTISCLLAASIFVSLASRVEADICDTITDHINQNQPVLDMLRQQIDLQQMDLNSYNPDQHNTPEYVERKLTYDSLVENYNAQVVNHNRQVDVYKHQCE